MIDQDISNELYHATPACGSTVFRDFARLGPRAHRLRYLMEKTPPIAKHVQTDAQYQGEVFEYLVDHGIQAFEDNCAVNPYDSYRTKASKEWRDDMKALGKFILVLSVHRRFLYMYDSIFKEPAIATALEPCTKQVSFFWDCPGLPGLKSRPDYVCLRPQGGYSIDLKTTATLDGFEHSIARYGYHAQAAMVRSAMRAHDMQASEHYLLGVEKAFPHRARLYRFTPEYLDEGATFVSEQCAKLARHIRDDNWPTVTDPLVDVGPPSWLARPDFEEEQSDE